MLPTRSQETLAKLLTSSAIEAVAELRRAKFDAPRPAEVLASLMIRRREPRRKRLSSRVQMVTRESAAVCL